MNIDLPNLALPLRFTWPTLLWALLLIPLALVAYAFVQRRRGHHVARFTNPDLLPNLLPKQPGWRRHVPPAFYVLALSGLLAALARPQATFAVPKETATVVLVMDTSVSMGATDVLPNRLVAANAAAKRFIQSLPPNLRVALISFSNGAQVQSAPTTDRVALQRAIDSLHAEGGTAMGDAIQLATGIAASARDESLDSTGNAPGASSAPGSSGSAGAPGAGGAGGTGTRGASGASGSSGAGTPAASAPASVLLLSDGANTAGQLQPDAAAARARELGIPVYTIALGTSAGTIESPDAPGSGQMMSVPPDEDTLRRVAQVTGGQFFKAPTAADLQAVYKDLGSRVAFAQEEQEITHAFLGAGAVLLVAGGICALLWLNRFP